MNKKMLDSLNQQINREIYSSYLYLSMASYAASLGLKGFANWFNVQVKEELSHAEKIYSYVIQQGERVWLKAIEQPPQDFISSADLFRRTLEHEKKVTKMINDLVNLAGTENDHATQTFLQWFVTEQAEEEENAAKILEKLEGIGKSRDGLIMIDSQLTKRVFVTPGA